MKSILLSLAVASTSVMCSIVASAEAKAPAPVQTYSYFCLSRQSGTNNLFLMAAAGCEKGAILLKIETVQNK